MARPRTHTYWVAFVEHLLGEDDQTTSAEIRRQVLEKSRNNTTPTPPPSDRAIRRIVADWRTCSAFSRGRHAFFRFPESMVLERLEWAAAGAGLELLGLAIEAGAERPTNRLVERFWRITEVAPGASSRIRLALTVRWIVFSTLERHDDLRALEEYIARCGWRPRNVVERYQPGPDPDQSDEARHRASELPPIELSQQDIELLEQGGPGVGDLMRLLSLRHTLEMAPPRAGRRPSSQDSDGSGEPAESEIPEEVEPEPKPPLDLPPLDKLTKEEILSDDLLQILVIYDKVCSTIDLPFHRWMREIKLRAIKFRKRTNRKKGAGRHGS